MTFVAQKTRPDGPVTVQVTYGPITFKVDEDPHHLAQFVRDLAPTLGLAVTDAEV